MPGNEYNLSVREVYAENADLTLDNKYPRLITPDCDIKDGPAYGDHRGGCSHPVGIGLPAKLLDLYPGLTTQDFEDRAG